jgi:hypothetical protein
LPAWERAAQHTPALTIVPPTAPYMLPADESSMTGSRHPRARARQGRRGDSAAGVKCGKEFGLIVAMPPHVAHEKFEGGR